MFYLTIYSIHFIDVYMVSDIVLIILFKIMFYLTIHSIHFIDVYMVLDILIIICLNFVVCYCCYLI